MRTIKEILDKCKGEWYLALVLILVILLAFGLGRLSRLEQPKFPIKIQQIEQANNTNNVTTNVTTQNNNGQVVGSKQGSKYHFPWCSGAKRIKPENLVTFATIEKARVAGYEPAANCEGLN